MRIVCKNTDPYSIFVCGVVYEAEKVPTSPIYKNGEWYNRFHYEVVDEFGRHFRGEPSNFYSMCEWRKIQLEKILNV